MDLVIKSKLMPPRLNRYLIDRPRLVKLLSPEEPSKLTVLTAPAGYGKTVAVRQLVATIAKPLVWYQLDAGDNDAVLFLQYMIAGISKHLCGFGQETLQMLEQGDFESRFRLLVALVANELMAKAKNGMVIVFDDFHLISEPIIHEYIKEFITYLPPGISVIITSRTSLPFSVSRLLLSDELIVAGTKELAFTREETKSFIELKQKKASEETVAFLEATTGGWPAALRLVGPETGKVTETLAIQEKKEIFLYMMIEIFTGMPEEIRDFLTATSVLEQITPGFCDRLLNRNDSLKILSYLEKEQLFVSRLSGQSKVYRYHHLFREFLQEQLGERKKALLKRAGELTFADDRLEEAIGYLSAGGLETELVPILRKAGRRTLLQGRWQTVAAWLQRLSKEIITADPWLSLFQAAIELYRGRPSEAESWVSSIEERFRNDGDRLGLGESQILKAKILRYRGHHQRCLQLLKAAEVNLSEATTKRRFDLLLEKCYCLIVTGHSQESEQILKQALKSISTKNLGFLQASIFEWLGNTYYVQGKYAKALQAYHHAREAAPDGILPNYYMQDLIPFIYNDWGQSDLALDYAERNLAVRERLGLGETLPSVYCSLSYVYLELGDYKLVEEYSKKAIKMINENKGDRAHLLLNKTALAWALYLQNQWAEARNEAEETLKLIDYDRREMVQSSSQACLAGIYALMGDYQRAKELSLEAITVLERMQHQARLCDGYRTMAFACFGLSENGPAGEYTGKFLAAAAAMNYVQGFLNTAFEMYKPILGYALEQGIETIFVHRILTRLKERALPILLPLARHQDPQVRARIIPPLAEIGGLQAESVLAELIRDRDPEIKRLTALTAKRFNLSAIIGKLENEYQKPAPPLFIQAIGSLKIYLHHQEVSDWRTAKTKELLVYLAHQNGPVSKERILEELWGDFELDKAAGLLRTTLYYLRKTLKEHNCAGLLLTENKNYYLAPDCFETDWRRFEDLISRGMAKNIPPEPAADQLKEAVKLYRGGYLREFNSTWMIPLQTHLDQLHSEARLRLARYYLEQDNYVGSLNHLTVLEKTDPLNEEVHFLLMTVYARMGRRKALKEQYQTLKSILNAEVGLEPSPKITDLYMELTK